MPPTFDAKADAFLDALPRLREQVNEALAAAEAGEPIPAIDPLPTPPTAPQPLVKHLIATINDLREVLEQVLRDRR